MTGAFPCPHPLQPSPSASACSIQPILRRVAPRTLSCAVAPVHQTPCGLSSCSLALRATSGHPLEAGLPCPSPALTPCQAGPGTTLPGRGLWAPAAQVESSLHGAVAPRCAQVTGALAWLWLVCLSPVWGHWAAHRPRWSLQAQPPPGRRCPHPWSCWSSLPPDS